MFLAVRLRPISGAALNDPSDHRADEAT